MRSTCLILTALATFIGTRVEAADCAQEFASERLQLRCLTTLLQEGRLRSDYVLRADSILALQGYERRFGLVSAPSDPIVGFSLFPILQYSSDVNGGNLPGELALGNFVFLPDPELERKSGLIVGAGVGSEIRFLLGEGRYVDIDLTATYGYSPEHSLDVSSFIGGICSKNHLVNWWYLDFCAASVQVSKPVLFTERVC
jgi:hypothetical protein